MAHKPETVDRLRTHYVYDRMDMPAACAATGIPEPTGRTIKSRAKKKGDDWDKARIAVGVANGGVSELNKVVLTDFTVRFKAVMTLLEQATVEDAVEAAQALARLADAYTKMMGALGKSEPGLTRHGVALDTLRLLTGYLREHERELLPEFTRVLSGFGPYLQKRLS